jgi:hypothetical protein
MCWTIGSRANQRIGSGGGKLSKRSKSTSRYRYLKVIIPIILISVIPLLRVVIGSSIGSDGPAQEITNNVSISFMTAGTIKSYPEYAAACGVRGLVEIGYGGTPESASTLVGSRGERVTVPIFISFISLDPNLTSIDVLIDPSGEVGTQRWQYWSEYDSQGTKINSGEISINGLISYDKEGVVSIEAGGRVELNMFVDIPPDLPPLKSNSILLVGAGIGLLGDRGIYFSDALSEEIELDE